MEHFRKVSLNFLVDQSLLTQLFLIQHQCASFRHLRLLRKNFGGVYFLLLQAGLKLNKFFMFIQIYISFFFSSDSRICVREHHLSASLISRNILNLAKRCVIGFISMNHEMSIKMGYLIYLICMFDRCENISEAGTYHTFILEMYKFKD